MLFRSGPGHSFPIGGGRSILSFPTEHRRGLTLGYSIQEQRKRLHPALQGVPDAQIAEMRRAGKQVDTPFTHNLLVYGGDGRPLPASAIQGADILFHEATFLGDGVMDPARKTHSTLAEAIDAAAAGGARRLALFHFSPRYQRQEIEDAVAEAASSLPAGRRLQAIRAVVPRRTVSDLALFSGDPAMYRAPEPGM